MCMGCMTNADFVLTSGIVGAASIRVGVRRLLPGAPRWTRKVSDEEAAGFLASLDPAAAHSDEPAHLAPDGGPAYAAANRTTADTTGTGHPAALAPEDGPDLAASHETEALAAR
jgi:hypothetical protein